MVRWAQVTDLVDVRGSGHRHIRLGTRPVSRQVGHLSDRPLSVITAASSTVRTVVTCKVSPSTVPIAGSGRGCHRHAEARATQNPLLCSGVRPRDRQRWVTMQRAFALPPVLQCAIRGGSAEVIGWAAVACRQSRPSLWAASPYLSCPALRATGLASRSRRGASGGRARRWPQGRWRPARPCGHVGGKPGRRGASYGYLRRRPRQLQGKFCGCRLRGTRARRSLWLGLSMLAGARRTSRCGATSAAAWRSYAAVSQDRDNVRRERDSTRTGNPTAPGRRASAPRAGRPAGAAIPGWRSAGPSCQAS